MNYLLIVFILVAVVLHMAEHFLRKYKGLIAWVNIAFHLFSLFAFVFLRLELRDLLLFLLCSALISLFLKYKEAQHGI